MIKVFNGQWRGLGKKGNGLGLLVGFEFRNYLHEFKGASLAIFMSIVLHADENGHSYPSYDLLEKETGYTRGTIAEAIDALCKMEIEGHRVLARYRERDARGHYTGSNHYLIFPTTEEVQSIKNPTLDKTHSTENPTMEKSNGGKTIPEVKPSLKDKPNKPASKKPEAPHLYPVASALAEVTGMDFAKNKGRLFREAKAYYAAGDDQTIKADYGPGGLWYRQDWRGKLAQRPTLAQIRETWGALNVNGNGKPVQRGKVVEAPATIDDLGGMNL